MKRKKKKTKYQDRIGIKACGGKRCGSSWAGATTGLTKIKVAA